ncbi:MAG: glycosyltransferase family 2 protein [Candidatus Aminicenantes bacterium]|nr:glycosyltransferase family 2 protein [Candidatus Aminicenantes bacterium]
MEKAVTLTWKPKVCLIVLNWMNYDLCSRLLRAFRDLTYSNLDVVLVDNGSPDGSGRRLSRDFPEIAYVALRDNLGYAAGNNAGMKRALERGADLVFLLNFDLTILTCQIIEHMVSCFQSISELGILNPLILLDSPSSGMSNRQFRRGLYFHVIQRMLVPERGFRQTLKNGAILEERPFAHGSAMMISRECLERVGFLNEEFFMYMVEPEYCFRSRQNGFLTMVLLDEHARVVHHVSITQKPLKTFFYARNQFLFLRLFSFCRQMLIFLVFFGSLVERTIHFIRKREPLSALYHITGFCSGLRIWVKDLIGWSESGQYLLEEKIRFQRFRKRN